MSGHVTMSFGPVRDCQDCGGGMIYTHIDRVHGALRRLCGSCCGCWGGDD